MPTTRVVGDALWRALCPSVDAKCFSKAIDSPLFLTGHARVGREQCANGWRPRHYPGQARAIHTSGSLARPSAVHHSSTDAPPEQPPPTLNGGPNSKPELSGTHSSAPGTPLGKQRGGGKAEAKGRIGSMDRIYRYTTRELYEELRAIRNRRRQDRKIRLVVDYLIRERGERPNTFLYEALVTANWDPNTGSAGELKAIIYEMKGAGIEPSQSFYHSALRVC